MKIGLIICARIGSKRLHGKALLRLGEHSVIGLMIERLKRSRYGDHIILATSKMGRDDPLIFVAEEQGIFSYRGSEDDVLGRMCGACDTYGIDVFVRLTGDCPLIDPEVVDICADYYFNHHYDMVTTKYNFPMGIDCEVLSYELLKKISTLTQLQEDREHVTLYLWKNRQQFNIFSITAPPDMDCAEYILTLDDLADYERIKKIVDHFGKRSIECTGREIIGFLTSNPQLIARRDLKAAICYGNKQATTC